MGSAVAGDSPFPKRRWPCVIVLRTKEEKNLKSNARCRKQKKLEMLPPESFVGLKIGEGGIEEKPVHILHPKQGNATVDPETWIMALAARRQHSGETRGRCQFARCGAQVVDSASGQSPGGTPREGWMVVDS